MIHALAAKATVVAYELDEKTGGHLLAKPSDILNIRARWDAFAKAGTTANKILGFILAAAVVVCVAMVIIGFAKQRFGGAHGKNSYSSEEGKGLLISGLVGLAGLSVLMPLADAMWVLPGVN